LCFAVRSCAVLSAEQFRDALTAVTGIGYTVPAAEIHSASRGGGLRAEQTSAVTPKWIWSEPDAASKAKTGAIYLRKDFYLNEIPAEAAVVVMCDNSFFFNVNGQRIGQGDDFTQPYVFDIRSRLKKGANFVAGQAVNRLLDNTEAKKWRCRRGPGKPGWLSVLCTAALRHERHGLRFGRNVALVFRHHRYEPATSPGALEKRRCAG
jgi:hypothetical protein